MPLSATTRRPRTQANTGAMACWPCCCLGERLGVTARQRAYTPEDNLVLKPPFIGPIACAVCPLLGIGPILMEFDVRTIQVPQLDFGALSQHGQHPGKQARGAPAPVVSVELRPRFIALGEIAPQQAGGQDEDASTEQKRVAFGWGPPSRHCTIMTAPCLSRCIRSIF